jgi:hypothetical protein
VKPGDCEVCGGPGTYEIYNMHGSAVYSIPCPECYGSGKAHEEEADAEPADWPPASTAARIKTMDELREWMASR